jgi:RNA polymerase sigma-70 factor, ECF subfamily
MCYRPTLTNFSRPAVYFPSDASGQQDEAGLIQQALDGNPEAFGTLVTRYQHVMYTVALRMLGNPEDARDVTQDAFVKAYRQLATFDIHYRFFSWMYRIVINESFNMIRARHPQEPLDIEFAGTGNPFDSALAVERHEHIEAALRRLTPEYRAVVVLRHFAGQSYGEIAAALDIPEKTVKSRLYSARQLLGEMLLGWNERVKEMK